MDQYKGIASIQKNSFIDYPGRVSALLFYHSCNLRCPYCHNAKLVTSPYEEVIPHEEIDKYLIKRKNFLDGIAITGGEPTLNKNLGVLIDYLKNDLGYDIKLDSNGLKPDVLKGLKLDYLAIDFKTSFSKYNSKLGYKLDTVKEKLLETFDIVRSMGDNSEIRITAAPEILTKDDVIQMAPFLKDIKKVYLQPFKYSDELLDSSFFNNSNHKHIEKKDLLEYKEIFLEYAENVDIRGI